MSFPFGGFKTPTQKKRGRYSGNLRDFKAESEFDEGDGDKYQDNLNMIDHSESQTRFEEEWIHEHNVNANLYEKDHIRIWAIGQSHMDIAWLWRLTQIVNKAKITFGKAAWHIKHIPEFTFTFSQPLMLEWLEKTHPKTFEDVKDAIKTGRFELQGGCYIECDGKLPSGESWCRQRLYGQGYYRKKFGKIAEVEWLPDSFGYTNNIPQFAAKSGAKYFFTEKISGNWPPVEFPFAHFKWRSPDGSELICYSNNHQFRPLERWQLFGHVRRILKPNARLICDYNTPEPKSSPELGEIYPEVGLSYGVGDGGHGPQSGEIHAMRYYIRKGYLSGFISAKDYFLKYNTVRDRLPVWNGADIFYNLHRGTLTTQGLVKKMNRYFEWHLNGLQSLYALYAFSLHNSELAQHETFTRLWKDMLLLQFHDILPGSSVPEVYDDCYDIWTENKAVLDTLSVNLLHKFFPAQENLGINDFLMLGIMNGTFFNGITPVEIEIKPPFENILMQKSDCWIVRAADGSKYPAQLLAGEDFDEPLINAPLRLLTTVPLPAWSARAFHLEPIDHIQGEVTMFQTASTYILKNDFTELILDRQTGAILSYHNVPTNREIFRSPSHLFQVYRDWAPNEPAWNIGPGYRECPFDREEFKFEGWVIREQGPVRWTLEAKYLIPESKSRISSRISVYASLPGIYCEIVIDWQQTDALLKAYYSLGSTPNQAIAEGPYTTETYTCDPTKRTPLDAQRWECYAHTWLAFPSPDRTWGVLYLNDSKYGFDIRNEEFGVTLVRGPEYPIPPSNSYVMQERKSRTDGNAPTHTDQMMHCMRFAFIPFEGDWNKNAFAPMAHIFNMQPFGFIFSSSNSSIPKDWRGFPLQIEPATLECVSFKFSESDQQKHLIIRVVETARVKTVGKIRFHASLHVADVEIVDLLEDSITDAAMLVIKDQERVLGLRGTWNPHEIRTFKIISKN